MEKEKASRVLIRNKDRLVLTAPTSRIQSELQISVADQASAGNSDPTLTNTHSEGK